MRHMTRDDWTSIVKESYTVKDCEYRGLSGKAGLIKMGKGTKEFLVPSVHEGKIKITEEGFSWLQIAFKEAFFWCTAMFDDKGKLMQLYVDMTSGNIVDDDPRFEDMYLDYVLNDEDVFELDRNELIEAHESKKISDELYNKVCFESDRLYSILKKDRESIIKDLYDLYDSFKLPA